MGHHNYIKLRENANPFHNGQGSTIQLIFMESLLLGRGLYCYFGKGLKNFLMLREGGGMGKNPISAIEEYNPQNFDKTLYFERYKFVWKSYATPYSSYHKNHKWWETNVYCLKAMTTS